jgi:hypothetical protein
MRGAVKAVVDGFVTVIDLAPPPPRRLSAAQGTASHWEATGAYLWRAVEANQPAREAQRPLFDADALPSQH